MLPPGALGEVVAHLAVWQVGVSEGLAGPGVGVVS